MRIKNKIYEIKAAKRLYGVFPFTEDGRKKARRYLLKLKKEHSEKFELIETTT